MTLEEFSTYMIGFNLYAEGETVEACASDIERKGWYGARLGHMHSDNVVVVIEADVPHEKVDDLAKRLTLRDMEEFDAVRVEATADDNYEGQYGWMG